MEHSEFTPPVRTSLNDDEISKQLGSVSADEAGMLAAMDFLEAQTKLREQDNLATDSWLQRMKESLDPRASLALENFERTKSGLEPLAQVPEVVLVPEVVVIPEVVVVPEPQAEIELGSAEENVEAFEELLEAETAKPEISSEALVVSHPSEQIAEEKPVRGFRLVSASNWIIGVGVLVPAVGAVIANQFGLNFVTSILAALIGVLAGLKVNVLGLLTARRTNRGLAVASRATFGVFGSILPGLLLLLSGLSALGVIAFGAARYLDGRIIGLSEFTTVIVPLGNLSSITLGSVLTISLVVLAGALAIFGGVFSRVLKVTLGAAILGGFLFFAGSTTAQIDFLNLAGVFQLEGFLLAAPLFALIVSVFTYGADGESLSIASWGASRRRLAWPVLIFGCLLSILTYAHVAALLSQRKSPTGELAIDFLLGTSGTVAGTVMLDTAIVAVVAVLYFGVLKVIEGLKTLGVNHIGYGSAIALVSILAALVSIEVLFVADPLTLNLAITSLLLVPAAAWIGAVLAETLLRRGKFHDASLTRSYGFYRAFNWISVSIFLVVTTFSWSISEPIPEFGWLGFLISTTNFSVSLVVAGLVSLAASYALTLATAYPSIARQQSETAAVEDRKFDLQDVTVE